MHTGPRPSPAIQFASMNHIPPRRRAFWIAALSALPLFFLGAGPADAVELTLLSKDNWTRLSPKGKEADAIFGDFVLRSDRATLVVAFPRQRRNASFATRDVGGSIIDFEAVEAPSDQLAAFYPGGG